MVEEFKNTDAGIIPLDWQVLKLSIISDFENGKAHEQFIDDKGDYIVVNSKFISTEGNVKKFSKINLSPLLKGNIVIVMSDIPNGKALAKCFLVERDNLYTLNQRIGCIKPYVDIDNDYLFYKLNRNKYFLSFDSGAGQTNLKKNEILDCPVALPPTKAEQTAIATVLNDTDALITQLEKLIAKKRNIKQGAMQELLKPKDGWKVKTLREMALFRRGSFPQPYGLPEWYDDENGMPFVQVFDVDGNMKLKETTKQKISDLAKSKSVFVEKGTVILTIQGSIGRIAITQYDSYLDRTLLIFTNYLIPMDKVFFMYMVFQLFQIEKQRAPGGTIKTITKDKLSEFEIHYPKINEQEKIAKIISDMDSEIEALEKKLEKYKMLKQGMMQNLLTGKIRLI